MRLWVALATLLVTPACADPTASATVQWVYYCADCTNELRDLSVTDGDSIAEGDVTVRCEVGESGFDATVRVEGSQSFGLELAGIAVDAGEGTAGFVRAFDRVGDEPREFEQALHPIGCHLESVSTGAAPEGRRVSGVIDTCQFVGMVDFRFSGCVER